MRRDLVSSPLENLFDQPEGTRFFAVSVLDPETGLVLLGSIALVPEMLERARQLNPSVRDPVPLVAAGEVIRMIWGDEPPEAAELRGIEELTRDQLAARIRERNERRESVQAS